MDQPLDLICQADLPLIQSDLLYPTDPMSDCSWKLKRGNFEVANFQFYRHRPRKVKIEASLEHGTKAWHIVRVMDSAWAKDPRVCHVRIMSVGLEAQGNWSCSLNLMNGYTASQTTPGLDKTTDIVLVGEYTEPSFGVYIDQRLQDLTLDPATVQYLSEFRSPLRPRLGKMSPTLLMENCRGKS